LRCNEKKKYNDDSSLNVYVILTRKSSHVDDIKSLKSLVIK